MRDVNVQGTTRSVYLPNLENALTPVVVGIEIFLQQGR